MMNFMLSTYTITLKNLEEQIKIAGLMGVQPVTVDAGFRAHVEQSLRDLLETAARLEWSRVVSRIHRIQRMMGALPSWQEIANQLTILHEAHEDDTEELFIYVYPAPKADLLRNLQKHWDVAFDAFPSIEEEVEAGVDCFALEHNTACVFHMCRVAEIGLRAVGQEMGVTVVKRGSPIEWATWGQVFQKAQPHVEEVRKKPNGPKKDAALAFYDPIISDLRAMQSLYRDNTMHLRERYDPGEAYTAIYRTHELMTKISTKLCEDSVGPIDWGF